jgi:hypothetical protein
MTEQQPYDLLAGRLRLCSLVQNMEVSGLPVPVRGVRAVSAMSRMMGPTTMGLVTDQVRAALRFFRRAFGRRTPSPMAPSGGELDTAPSSAPVLRPRRSVRASTPTTVTRHDSPARMPTAGAGRA